MEPSVFAKGPEGQYFSDITIACEDFFNRNYPDYANSADHGTVLFYYDRNGRKRVKRTPIGQASSDMEKNSIKGNKAELKMFHMLEKFGQETIQPMFVFKNFKISKFIIHILNQKLPSNHPSLAKNLEKEIDFLIIHRQIGVILIEVKAALKFTKSLKGKARNQLQLGEEKILALLHADDKQEIKIPVYKVIAMPNVCDPCQESQNFINLREINVRSDGHFISWWEMKFAKKEFGCHEKRQLQSLISILFGQACGVSPAVFLDVCMEMENQNLPCKSYEKITRQAGTGSQGVMRTSEQPEQAILAKQFLFLNPSHSGYIAPTGQASGATALSDIEKDSFRGDTAELKMFHMLEKFKKETIQPMFILTNFEISKFIINILKQKLPSNHPILAKALKTEIDFLIIHQQIGVILIEVKAAEKFFAKSQDQARKQLQLREKIILALLHADDKQEINIPIYKVVAMPNVCGPCYKDQNFINLREINVRSDGDFISWWEMKFAKKEFGCHKKRQLQSLISILDGQTCEVSSDVLLDVCKEIENQNFPRKSHEKITRQAGTGSQGVVRTSEQPEQAILRQQILFLTLDQLRIWKGPLHQCFNGIFGSGKTTLLQHKALECANKGEKVVAVVPSSLTALYKNFFAKNNISSGVDVLSPSEFFHGQDPASDVAKFHFFADELQVFQTEIPDMLMRLEKLLIHLTDLDCYCWIAYDYMQINNSDITQDEEVTDFICGAALQSPIRKLCKTYNYYHAPCLSTTMKPGFEVYMFVKKFLLALPKKIQLPLFGHIGKATKDIMVKVVEHYDVANHIGHHIGGSSVTVFQNSDFNFITQVIQNEVKKWGSLHEVAVLLPSAFPKEQLSHLMTEKNIPVCNIGNTQKNAVVLDFAHKAYSYQWPVVIAISQSPNLSSNYIMFTRAVLKLVVIMSAWECSSL